MKKASEKFIEYYEAAEGNKITKYKAACKQFVENHSLTPPYKDYYSFYSAYTKHLNAILTT